MMKKIKFIIDKLPFFVVNFIGSLLIPKIEEIQFRDARIIPYNKRYLTDLIDIRNSWGEGSFSKTDEYLLKFFGKKTCFLMIDKNEELMGYSYFYFHFDDLKKHRIHFAFGGVKAKFRGRGYGGFLFKLTWNSFKKTKWIRGISSRYTLSNIPSRKLHEEIGFKTIKKYFDNNLKKERIYAVYDFYRIE